MKPPPLWTRICCIYDTDKTSLHLHTLTETLPRSKSLSLRDSHLPHPPKKSQHLQPSGSKFHFISHGGKARTQESIHDAVLKAAWLPWRQIAPFRFNPSELTHKHTPAHQHARTHTQVNICFTCAQYWDLATATSSLRMGCDWDTRLETAWMTAVNFGDGFIPETYPGQARRIH